jgi:DNA-binding response OmpR family regulator
LRKVGQVSRAGYSAKVDVLLIEDDPQLSALLTRVIREEGAAATACANAEVGRALALQQRHDVIVLDWMLPDRDGVELCRELRAYGLLTPILMLTARGEVADRVKGLRCGADDYLTKPFEIDELLARLDALVRRASQRVTVEVGGISVDRLDRRVWVHQEPVELTTKEFDLLLHLMLQKGSVISRAELLERVWNLKFDPGSGLLDVHVSRLRDKLGKCSEQVETVRGVGYRMRADL